MTLAELYQVAGTLSSACAVYFAALAALRSKRAEREAKIIHVEVNSRMSELLEQAKKASLRKGREEERERLLIARLEEATEAQALTWTMLADARRVGVEEGRKALLAEMTGEREKALARLAEIK